MFSSNLPDRLCSALRRFTENHNFPSLYRSYEWYEDTWRAGLPRMLGLEATMRIEARENRLFREHLLAVERWGRKQGHRVEAEDEIDLSLYSDGEIRQELADRPELPLLELDEQTKYFGPTYLSKVFLFAAPEEYGAIDTRMVTVFGQGGRNWFNLGVSSAGSGAAIKKTQAGWPSEYGTWIHILRWLASSLNDWDVGCPHPEAYVQSGLRSEGQWCCADVQTALFSYATRKLRSV